MKILKKLTGIIQIATALFLIKLVRSSFIKNGAVRLNCLKRFNSILERTIVIAVKEPDKVTNIERKLLIEIYTITREIIDKAESRV